MFCNNRIFHNWSQWSIKEEAALKRTAEDGRKIVVGRAYIQQRQCQICGLTQTKGNEVMLAHE